METELGGLVKERYRLFSTAILAIVVRIADSQLVAAMNVSQFSAFTTVLALCVAVPPALAQAPQPVLVLPVVKSAEMPLYPHLARVARIEGTARMRVWTDGSSIVKVEGSGAHKLLMDAAEKNLRTWRFYPHNPHTFTVTFIFKLEQPEVYGPVNPTIQLDLPTRVEIRTKMPSAETVATDKPE